MIKLHKLTITLSQIHPLIYLAVYLLSIPLFGALYAVVAPHGFYAPYARYEPSAVSDRDQLAETIEKAIHRSFDERAGQNFIAGSWKLDLDSLRVDDIKSNDGNSLTFRVRLSAEGIGKFSGARQMGWSIVASVPERPTSVVLSSEPDRAITYRFPEVDFSKEVWPFKKDDEELFRLVFGQGSQSVGILAPSLALKWQEELRFQRYLRGIKGDASAISGHFFRMLYLSAVIITTLGLGDIIPLTAMARALVALEAVAGITLAGLFINALASRASSAKESRRKEALRAHLRAQYHEWRRDLVSTCLRGMNGGYSTDSKLERDLVNFKSFREYFGGDNKQRWYDVLNGLQSNEQFLEDILVVSDLFAQQVNYALGTIQTEDTRALAILTRVGQKPYLLKNLDMYSGDPVKYIGQYVFEVLSMFSVVNGYLNDDFIEVAINQL